MRRLGARGRGPGPRPPSARSSPPTTTWSWSASRVAGASTAMLLARQGHRVLDGRSGARCPRMSSPPMPSSAAVSSSSNDGASSTGSSRRGRRRSGHHARASARNGSGFRSGPNMGSTPFTHRGARSSTRSSSRRPRRQEPNSPRRPAWSICSVTVAGCPGSLPPVDGRETRVSSRVVIGADGVWSRTAELVDAPAL